MRSTREEVFNLGIFDRFRKKKEEKKKEEPMSKLEEICKGDKEIYEALADSMFLDPRKIEVSINDAVEKAKKFEKEKDFVNARVWYKIAGGLAIYEGDIKKVKELFTHVKKLSANEEEIKILKNPEKAVAKAQEYYTKYLT